MLYTSTYTIFFECQNYRVREKINDCQGKGMQIKREGGSKSKGNTMREFLCSDEKDLYLDSGGVYTNIS